MKITKEEKQTIIDGEKKNFVYIQHPRYTDKLFAEIDTDNITLVDWAIIVGSTKGGILDLNTELEFHRSMFMRRLVILSKFIKWLYKKT